MRQFLQHAVIIYLFMSFCPLWAFSPYSNRELEQLERQFIEQINQASNVIRIPLANQYINDLGKTLAQHGQLTPPHFFLVNSDVINAFAGPGGYIGVNSQLILVSANESELAGVMAHEMAHVRLHHLYQMIEHQKQMRIPMLASMLAAIALGAINPTLGSGALMASLTGFAQDNINFVRANEKAADRIGIDMLIKSGLDPRGMANFFKKMQESMRYYYTANVPAILRTHPLDEDRIAEAESRCAALKKQTYHSNPDYYLFKELIRNNVEADPKALLDYYRARCQSTPQDTSCQYGYALALASNNQFQAAKMTLQPLALSSPDNFYYAIAMASFELNLNQTAESLQRLKTLLTNHPDNYALMIEYARNLLLSKQPQQAISVLLRGSWQFKNDLPLCLQLARAYAANHQKDYAYFTEAQCHLLQGQRRAAMSQLKLAKSLLKNDKFLRARIEAKMQEVKEMNE